MGLGLESIYTSRRTHTLHVRKAQNNISTLGNRRAGLSLDLQFSLAFSLVPLAGHRRENGGQMGVMVC